MWLVAMVSEGTDLEVKSSFLENIVLIIFCAKSLIIIV